MVSRVVFSSLSDEYGTPSSVLNALDREFHFDLDSCPLGATDGLEREWRGNIFVNPPYSNIDAFMRKGREELTAQRAQSVVYLVPARTDTAWFHEYCLGRASEIRFIRGRLKFNGAKNNAPFPSMVVVCK